MSRLFLLSFFVLLAFPAMAVETLPGNACTAGQNGQHRRSTGYILVCNGTTWNNVVDYSANTGRSGVEIDNDTGTCTTVKAGRIRYDNAGDIWNYCNGSCWKQFPPTSSADVTTGLISKWKMDETSGTTVADSVGTNTGTWNGSVAVVSTAGKIGTALNFDGVDDYVNIPDSTDFTGSSFTASAWVFYGGSYPTADEQNIVSKYDQTAPDSGKRQWLLRVETDGDLMAIFMDSGCAFVSGLNQTNAFKNADPLPTGQWVHIVGVFDSSEVSLYRNGTQLATATPTSVCTDVAAAVRIGMRQGNADRSALIIDDVRIYNRALSDAEVSTLYNYTGSGVCQ